MDEDYGCILVDPDALWMGRIASDGIPALRVDEYVEVSGQEPWVSTSYFGPAVARIQDGNVDIMVDLAAGWVAFADSDDTNWSVHSLEDWQAYIENLRGEASAHLTPSKPRYESSDRELVSGLESRQYHLAVKLQTPGTAGELIEQELWMTKAIETTREIYSTYRRAKLLFDRNLIEVPAELPRGIIMRSRSLRRALDGAPGDAAQEENATVVDVGYEFLPRDFFIIDASAGVSPVSFDGGR